MMGCEEEGTNSKVEVAKMVGSGEREVNEAR